LLLAEVNDPKAGGTVLFIGTVRDNSDAGDVDMINYDAYLPMAEKRMVEIEEEVKRMWPVRKVAARHRIGDLKVGEVSVVVAVSAPHRAEAFEACRHAIERIKHDVPIWKKERLADGQERWVQGKVMRMTTMDKITKPRTRSSSR
ncbi:MAG: molybdenum cofactor biosynthesis protein MoaE, partial [Thaumarchaeota archaeon]|nr:molybdenum cofactor biosynthesis protein MoaE [Nitrososphaerota archaeon]